MPLTGFVGSILEHKLAQIRQRVVSTNFRSPPWHHNGFFCLSLHTSLQMVNLGTKSVLTQRRFFYDLYECLVARICSLFSSTLLNIFSFFFFFSSSLWKNLSPLMELAGSLWRLCEDWDWSIRVLETGLGWDVIFLCLGRTRKIRFSSGEDTSENLFLAHKRDCYHLARKWGDKITKFFFMFSSNSYSYVTTYFEGD